jgi:tartrate dehydrogenase/decarboxylase/D-malate dehydrogenase
MAAEQGDFRCDFTHLPWGCDYYLQTGKMLDDNGIALVSKFDAIYLGAIGDPRVADHISARDLILPIRQQLRQYVNLPADASAVRASRRRWRTRHGRTST